MCGNIPNQPLKFWQNVSGGNCLIGVGFISDVMLENEHFDTELVVVLVNILKKIGSSGFRICYFLMPADGYSQNIRPRLAKHRNAIGVKSYHVYPFSIQDLVDQVIYVIKISEIP